MPHINNGYKSNLSWQKMLDSEKQTRSKVFQNVTSWAIRKKMVKPREENRNNSEDKAQLLELLSKERLRV